MFACNLHNQFLYSVIQSCKKKNDNPERKKTFDLSMQSLEKRNPEKINRSSFSQLRLFTLAFRQYFI